MKKAEIQQFGLEQKTQLYWILSKCRNGRDSRKISTGVALKTTSDLLQYLNPSRGLFYHIDSLRDDIIKNKPLKRSKVSAKVLHIKSNHL